MKLITALIATIALSSLPDCPCFAAPQPDDCDVPASFIESEVDLTRATNEMKDKHRLDISVVGTGSSTVDHAPVARVSMKLTSTALGSAS